MMRHPEHHPHVPPTSMQRSRINIPQMGPPAQRMLMTVPGAPHTGVIVSMQSGPTLMSNTTIAPLQQQQQAPPQQHPPKNNNTLPQAQQVYYDQMSNTDPNEAQSEQSGQVGQVLSNTTTSSSVPNLANIKEKTPMCLVNELARYNKIQHQYRLTGEQGPAHKKIFTVTLKLGDEEYEAEGASIKKAQHSAAAQALEKTQLKHPPPKSVKTIRGNMRTPPTGVVTPTVELNALAMKRGERTVYIVENGAPHHAQGYMPQAGYYPRYNPRYPQGQPRFNYDAGRNNAVRGHYQYDNRFYGQYKFPHPNGEPYTVRLRIGEREYPGTGYTVQAARHDAAAKAIEDIKRMNAEDGEQYTEVGDISDMNDTGSSDLNSDLKSPISLVYEIALKRHLQVVFEVLSEKGPPHMKVFVTQCRIGDLLVEGEGNGKKISKKRAAEKMLEKLSKLPPIPNMNTMARLKRKRVATKKKTRNLIKVNCDKSTEFTEDINPISRLIQIQQANKEKEPVYTVLEERGAARRREFVIQASVNGYACKGVGPNKKIAKRNAAQALLTDLGYANHTNNTKIVHKDKQPDVVEKPRKVTFMEEKADVPVGGSSGRQIAPGLLLVGDQSVTMQNKPKGDNAPGVNITETKKAVTTNKVNTPPTQGVRSKDKLLYLAQLMNIQVQFSDFPKANHEQYLTLVSLSTIPQQVCHGEGPTTEASQEKAALEALNVLSELGLDIAAKDNSNEGGKPQVGPGPKTGLTQNGSKK